VRSGDRDPDPGEAAGTDTDDDPLGAAAAEKLIEHRDQPFGVSPSDPLVHADDALARPVEQGGGAGGTRRVER